MPFELSKELISHLEDAIENQDVGFIQEHLDDLHAADITAILYELNTKESKYVLDLLDVELSAEILTELYEDTRAKFLKNFTPEELAHFVEHIESDDAADILNEQVLRVRQETIAQLKDKEKAAHIVDLLRYDEDTAGGLMAKELIKANENWTVVQCIDEIRRQASKVDRIYSIYVVDDHDILLGRIPLKSIVLASDDTKISELYEDDLQYVESFTSEEEVAQVMSKYDLTAIPVVNFQKKLLGRITIDDIVDVITEQAELERQLMAGISQNVEHRDSIWLMTRSRLPWLLIGMMGGLTGAKLIGFFEADLIAVPAMAFFIPLIMATGGNVGIQSSSIVVQGLASGSGLDDDVVSRLWKSFLVSIVNGVAISSLVFTFNLFFMELNIALVVSFSLFCVVLLSSFIGTLTPYILHRMEINPALASGPFITTLNDLLGIAVYFGVAKLLI